MDATLETVVDLFKQVHGDLRNEVRDLTPEQLAWTPAPETNSVAVLVVHTLASWDEVFRLAGNVPGSRDRDAEFRTAGMTAADLVARLDAADARIDELAAHVTPADLEDARVRGGNPPEQMRRMLLRNYGHAREHLAHIQLTKQMMADRQAEAG